MFDFEAIKTLRAQFIKGEIDSKEFNKLLQFEIGKLLLEPDEVKKDFYNHMVRAMISALCQGEGFDGYGGKKISIREEFICNFFGVVAEKLISEQFSEDFFDNLFEPF